MHVSHISHRVMESVMFSSLGVPGPGPEEATVCCEVCELGGSRCPDSWKLQEWDWAPKSPPAVQWPDYQTLWLVSVFSISRFNRAIYGAKRD